MRLGLNLGYWGAGNDADNLALAREADRLGYSVTWAAEAYGSDAATVLAWVAAQTERIDIGSAVFQIPGRTPANTAMTAATLDTLSGGRFRLGLGVSGPQVSEGWHGVRFDKPLARTREYVAIIRKALARERLTFDGEFFTLPLPDGPGKALTLTVHPVRERIPIYLAAVGPKNLELAGEIADGWLAIFYSPEYAPELLAQIAAGRAKVGQTLAGFDIVPTVPVEPCREVDVVDAAGHRVVVTGRHLFSSQPAFIVDGVRRHGVVSCFGPWPVEERWWDATRRRRVARMQCLVDIDNRRAAWLLVSEHRSWWLVGVHG